MGARAPRISCGERRTGHRKSVMPPIINYVIADKKY